MSIRVRKSKGASSSRMLPAEDDLNPPSINLTPAALEKLEAELDELERELAPEYSPPTFTPIGNLGDLLAQVDELGDCDPE